MGQKKKADTRTTPQSYPRINDRESNYFGCLDDSKLVQHQTKTSIEQVKMFIRRAIEDANRKSSREILSIAPDEDEEKIQKKYKREGARLLEYFKKYCADPAATAHQIQGKHYRAVGEDLFHRRTLQKERMNAGWRYQYLTLYCARETQRFYSISDVGLKEADLIAKIP